MKTLSICFLTFFYLINYKLIVQGLKYLPQMSQSPIKVQLQTEQRIMLKNCEESGRSTQECAKKLNINVTNLKSMNYERIYKIE